MSKPWGIGDWAADVEREEREQAAAAAASATAAGGSQSFPSLRESVTAKPKKKKMSLTEFYSETSSGARPKGLTPNEMLLLPTGPKERSAEEMQLGRLGGGFSSYGRGGPRGGGREDSGEGGGGGRRYGGFDDERRGPPSRGSDYDLPSRADEADNWATGKKVLPSADSGRSGRYGSLGGGGGGGFGGGSRADEVDNWGTGKKPALAPPPTRSSTFGSGFRDSPGAESDRWSRGVGGGGFGGGGGGDHEPIRDRPRLVLDARKGGLGGDLEPVRTNKPSPFGAARPREEVLAEKGLDWKKLDVEIETKKSSSQSSRPTSAQSSRPSSAHSSRSEGLQQLGSLENVVSKPKPKVNPFGEAKPREVLLQERGQDWRKIDLELEHRRVERPETEEEKSLKEEINHLKQDLQKESAPKEGVNAAEVSGVTQLVDTIAEKEKELEALIRDLDDKVRFGSKVVERPGSGAGRAPGFHERPPSQSGPVNESRNMEFADRPRSRGKPETWSRPSDERRSFRGTGFVGSREFDRPRSRDGW